MKRYLLHWLNTIDELNSNVLSGKTFDLVQLKLQPLLSEIFGYYSLLYTKMAKNLVEEAIVVKNSLIINDHFDDNHIICRFEELAIASDSIDLVVLPNILQKAKYPHQILREIERVLIPEGYVILIVENPLNRHSLKRRMIDLLNSNTQQILIGKSRIKDWFSLLALEPTVEIPISVLDHKVQTSNYPLWIKKISHFFCRYFNSYRILVAQKKNSTMTPIRASWRSNRKLVGARLAEPSIKAEVEKFLKQVKSSR